MSSKENKGYNRRLRPFASELRKNMTKAEACLWKYALKGKRMKGYSFRRQRPIHHYIADFICLELNLVIEVDGITHQWEETGMKDIAKQDFLEDNGFFLLRFKDEEVLNDLKKCIWRIEKFIEEKEFNQSSSVSQ